MIHYQSCIEATLQHWFQPDSQWHTQLSTINSPSLSTKGSPTLFLFYLFFILFTIIIFHFYLVYHHHPDIIHKGNDAYPTVSRLKLEDTLWVRKGVCNNMYVTICSTPKIVNLYVLHCDLSTLIHYNHHVHFLVYNHHLFASIHCAFLRSTWYHSSSCVCVCTVIYLIFIVKTISFGS